MFLPVAATYEAEMGATTADHVVAATIPFNDCAATWATLSVPECPQGICLAALYPLSSTLLGVRKLLLPSFQIGTRTRLVPTLPEAGATEVVAAAATNT